MRPGRQANRAWRAGRRGGHRNGVRLVVSRPGKPIDNAFTESFNGRFRDECLDRHWFASMEEARQTVEAWRVEEDTTRPHRALEQRRPAACHRP